MGSYIDDDSDESSYYDAQEEAESVESYSGSDHSEDFDFMSKVTNGVSSEFLNDVWARSPRSIQERRNNFLSWLTSRSVDVGSDNWSGEFEEGDGITPNGEAVLRSKHSEEEFYYSSSLSLHSDDDTMDSLMNMGSSAKFVCRTGNGGGAQQNVEELGQDDLSSDVQVEGIYRLRMVEEFSGASPSFQQFSRREIEETTSKVVDSKRPGKGWISKLLSMGCIIDKQADADHLGPDHVSVELSAQRVRVRQSNKKLKELSALQKCQDIHGHEGSILSMKFSLDGKYLATAGEDEIVRIWGVVEDERSVDFDIPIIDPSSMYFTVNQLSELAPLSMDKEKINKLKNMRKTSDSACVIFPPNVFRLMEKPLHEFHGHSGKILDLSWSKDNFLLSASADNTVRLWEVGCDHCLQVFIHSNFVTCAQFNPLDDNYFMSGSLDGKVRIWATRSCQVVGWTDIKEIVTAVCYRPDAQGGLVGSISGSCRFYSISDNHLQLDAHVSLYSKKKSLCKRITGFQFLPRDESKVMVTCADSQVRILDGVNVIGKYKGLRNSSNQTFASFTSDGKHIVSTCDDSSVCLWNCISPGKPAATQTCSIRSCEYFSANASIAIPWNGLNYVNAVGSNHVGVLDHSSHNSLPISSPARFCLGEKYLLDSFNKGSATWPEENLPATSPLGITPSTVCKSQYKFLKTSCQSAVSSHAWGLVIVIACRDGRIQSFHNYGLPVLT